MLLVSFCTTKLCSLIANALDCFATRLLRNRELTVSGNSAQRSCAVLARVKNRFRTRGVWFCTTECVVLYNEVVQLDCFATRLIAQSRVIGYFPHTECVVLHNEVVQLDHFVIENYFLPWSVWFCTTKLCSACAIENYFLPWSVWFCTTKLCRF